MIEPAGLGCSVRGCIQQGGMHVGTDLDKLYCLKHLQELKALQRDLSLAIQEFHALALLAPVVQDGHGHSMFQDWWPQDIREIQTKALAHVLQLRKLEVELKGRC